MRGMQGLVERVRCAVVQAACPGAGRVRALECGPCVPPDTEGVAARTRGRACSSPTTPGIIPAVFFILSKVLDWLLSPLSWALLLLVWAMLARARPVRSLVLTGLAAAILVVFSSETVAHRLEWAAEGNVRSTYRPDVVYDAVVVLGGMVDVVTSRQTGEVELDERADRIVRAWDLLRDGRARNVILSAGNAGLPLGQPTEAELLARLLVRWGVPADRIVVEPRSRNTHENAVESAKIAAARGWKTL